MLIYLQQMQIRDLQAQLHQLEQQLEQQLQQEQLEPESESGMHMRRRVPKRALCDSSDRTAYYERHARMAGDMPSIFR
jgi:hypothetical protein